MSAQTFIWQCAKNVCIWGRHHRTKVYPVNDKIMPKATMQNPQNKTEKQRREDRLAQALRSNLHRRKAQARGRDQDATEKPSTKDKT